MDLICFLHPAWRPLLRPASANRAWMDATPEAFAYRCLPLNIANAHGWELLSPCGFEASWKGGSAADEVVIRLDPGSDPAHAPVALFGQGVLTFHVEGIFRTPETWNLWVSGPPNHGKDGIAPLTGVIETDWSPYTFTMNWRFTRPGQLIRFEAGEPFCFLFPVQRGVLETFKPRLQPLPDDALLEQRFMAWSRSRDAFHEKMKTATNVAPADKWQKHYYRGEDSAGERISSRHQTKIRLKAFDASATPGPQAEALARASAYPLIADTPARPPEPAADPQTRLDLKKREWLMEAQERQRQLSPAAAGIPRQDRVDGEEFLDAFYAPGRPVVLTGQIADWPALTRWTPDYLKQAVGAVPVEFQGGRNNDPLFERNKDAHRQTAPFDAFIDMISGASGNDAYLTAYNSAGNKAALAPLAQDVRPIAELLTRDGDHPDGMMWIGPAGAWTPLHHDLTNNLIVQAVGRKRLILVPAAYAGRVYNRQHVFSEVQDLESFDAGRFPNLGGVHAYEVTLEPGEALFVPLGWWHQARALDFSVTLTFTNFRWPNDASRDYPA